MTPKTISVTSTQPVHVTSDQPVSIEIEGDTVTVSIEDVLPEPRGLASQPTERSNSPDGQVHQTETKKRVNLPDRCGVLMPRSNKKCARREGHNGVHMSAEQVQKKQDYNKDRARERYQNDPEYADKIKQAQKDRVAAAKKEVPEE